jgi:hypothetical protein
LYIRVSRNGAIYLRRKSASVPGQKSANFKTDFASRGEALPEKEPTWREAVPLLADFLRVRAEDNGTSRYYGSVLVTAEFISWVRSIRQDRFNPKNS